MKKKPEKEKDLEALRADLLSAAHVFLAGYEKTKVQQDFELRKIVRGAGAKYKVVKNSIAEKASVGTGSAELLKALKGMSSIAYTSGDPVALKATSSTWREFRLWRVFLPRKRFTPSFCGSLMHRPNGW
jgi:large subunit ribosomal protein L10